ncbi:cation:proton antiporter [Patescibacteria group bacterium]|nr:cation:proton antiporter [Patescibacteria group bacterium]
MNLIITLIVVLLISRLFVLLAHKLKLAKVVGLLLAGLLFGYPPMRAWIIEPQSETIFNLGNVALLALMFIAGLESSWREICKEEKETLIIAIFAMLIPFLCGFAVLQMLGFSLMASLMGGVCMSITAEATKVEVLLEFKKLKTKVGATMMTAGIIDDLLGLAFFVAITYYLGGARIAENFLIVAAVVAFFAGIILQKAIGRKHPWLKNFERILDYFLIPFFFVAIGLHFDFGAILLNPLILIAVIGTALIGKLAGTLLAKPFASFDWKQLYLIGWAMNSRGAIEMAFALIALNTKLVSAELYSALIVMALFTTLLFPVMFVRILEKNPKIMN